MKHNFDLIAIGTGSAASTVAYKCRAAGWKVAVVDSRPFGGTCALRGCDPKKVLVGAAELIDWQRRMAGKGIQAREVQINWPELMRFKRSFTEPVPKNREQGFTRAGIHTFHGRAHFVDANAIQVNNEILQARYIVVATGAEPVKLNIPGEEHITTSDQFLELDNLPRRIVFIGGGYISFEFAHVSARAGAEVCIFHRSSRPLKNFDPDLVQILTQATQELGTKVRLNAEVTAIENTGKELRVSTTDGDTFSADLVVHGAGRVPEISDLDLEKAGVEYDPRRGILVNKYLQSVSNPLVYAAGDVAASGGPPLTPVAALEGHVVASNLLKGNQKNPDYSGIPSVVFTIPPLAAVGLKENEAKAQGFKFRKVFKDTSNWYSSRRIGEKYSGFKTLIEDQTNRVLGAHLLGPHAEEVINIFALAIRLGLTADQIKHMIYAYPTSASDVSYML